MVNQNVNFASLSGRVRLRKTVALKLFLGAKETGKRTSCYSKLGLLRLLAESAE